MFDEYTLEYLRSGKTDGEKREEPDDGKAPREAARPGSGKQEKNQNRKKPRGNTVRPAAKSGRAAHMLRLPAVPSEGPDSL